jgi:hypothetical protein
MVAPLSLSTVRLIQKHITAADRRKRLLLYLTWLLLVGWLFSKHVMWRDEIRAFSLALSGADAGAMLRAIHGEGHPALWYLFLRGVHGIFPYREVLPVLGAVIGIAATAVFTFASPFRAWVVALGLFSLFGAFEYVVVARNYGIAALAMFALAAIYPRVKNSPWFGLILAFLCNTNVPSCFLAAAFLFFRFVEMLKAAEKPATRDWITFAINAGLALAGAIACLVTVYPPFNDSAVSLNYEHIGTGTLVAAVGDGGRGFSNLVLNAHGWLPPILLWCSCLAFIRHPPALIASVAALLALKLFFFFVYSSGYRHEALFVVFVLALHWIADDPRGDSRPPDQRFDKVQAVGVAAFSLLLVAQTLDLAKPLVLQAKGVPYSRSADVAQLLQRPELAGAIVMADPDIMLEPLPYYSSNPLWFMREEAFGKLFLRGRRDRQQITLDDILADADRLHRRYRRPIVILLHPDLRDSRTGARSALYHDTTMLTADGVKRFQATTRLLVRLRPAITDEAYDVYVYGA